jgi:hypothetical protein
VNHLSALSDQFLVRVIPKDGQSLILLGDLSGRSFWLLMICLSKVCQKMVCQFLVHEIPMDGQSSNVLADLMDALSGRSFLRHGRRSFCPSKVCQKKVGQFLLCVIPKDGQNEMLAYARLLNQNHGSRYRKVDLTSSFFPGGRKLDHRCEAYLSTRALERGHQILGNRRSFWCRALRGHRHCDEACALLQF